MQEHIKWRSWDLSGLKVTQLKLDGTFHVDMWALDRALTLTFSTSFTYRTPDGDVRSFDPGRWETLCPLLSLLHCSVATFAASSEGECVLRFRDGGELRGKPHEKYEAWETQAEGKLEGASMFCDIGGGSPWR